MKFIPYGNIKSSIDELIRNGVDVRFIRHTPGRFDYSDSEEVEINEDDVVYIEVNVRDKFMKDNAE